jgi:2-amino-4-hydroxy-6-hydroxymethyldihydropteridine diphosphokinase
MSGVVRRNYVIGLGANLGDRLSTLQAAVLALSAPGNILDVSGLYECAPVGPPQPDFLNAAVLLDSALLPGELLAQLLAVERAHGRERRERWGARTLDLDLLFSPGLLLDEPHLTLPHPELTRRAFALTPLVDLVPEARDPHSGTLYTDLLLGLGAQGVRRVETRAGWDPRPAGAAAPGRAE